MKDRIAIVDGIRTPMCKAGGVFADISADDLGAIVVSELLARSETPDIAIDEFIFGNVSQPVHAANIARVIALKSGIPESVPAYTVQRNCGSGAEAITTAADKILAGQANVVLVGGTESMSNIPLLFNKKMTALYARLAKARTLSAKMQAILDFRLGHLAPVIGVVKGLTDPVSGMIMGKTAEVLAREFHISRIEQDEYSLLSHQRACQAIDNGIMNEELIPLPMPPSYKNIHTLDDNPRAGQTIEQLQKLRPFFDRHNGTVTVGNSCPLTDGAAALMVMRESLAKELGLSVLGYMRNYAYAGLEPRRMGLGPVYATAKLFKKEGLCMNDVDLIELNEAFAAQVIANERAFASNEFAKTYLDQSTAVGEIDRNCMNVNGGAIALGHPVGMTGARLVLTLLKELRRQNKNAGVATMCIGGGQGGALFLEVA